MFQRYKRSADARGSFTEKKEQIQKLPEAGDLKYIYQNELSKMTQTHYQEV